MLADYGGKFISYWINEFKGFSRWKFEGCTAFSYFGPAASTSLYCLRNISSANHNITSELVATSDDFQATADWKLKSPRRNFKLVNCVYLSKAKSREKWKAMRSNGVFFQHQRRNCRKDAANLSQRGKDNREKKKKSPAAQPLSTNLSSRKRLIFLWRSF